VEKFRKLIRITVWLVCTVLILTCFGFYYISIKSDQDEAREEIERVSEKQQILSQQILKNVLLAISDKNANNTAARTELRRLLQLFRRQHQFLTIKITDAGLGSNQEKVQLIGLMQAASLPYNDIQRTANAALGRDLDALLKNGSLLREMDRSETNFLDKMDQVSKIARSNQEQVDDQVYRLNMFILATLAISLITLGLLVITPIFKKSVRDYKDLLVAKEVAEAASSALAEGEEKYRRLFASNPLPMWLFDPLTFNFLDVNDIACSHYGYTREEFLSMSVFDIRAQEHKQTFAEADHPLSLSAEHYDRGTWQHRKKDGTEIEVEIFAHDAVFNGSNARMVVINDITKRKFAEEKLKHNETNLEQAQQMAHFGHWELSFSTGKSIWSAEACRIYGLDEQYNEQTYESWLSFIHPQDIEQVLQHTKSAQQSYSRAEFYHRIVLRDGTIKHLFSQSHYEFDRNGNPVGMYGVAHDVTQQKIAEEKLINANRLYSVISGINQLIVHTEEESTLLLEACNIATKLGKFDLAWIGKVDAQQGTLRLLAHSNAGPQDLDFITDITYEVDGPVAKVLQTGSYYHMNDTHLGPLGSKIGDFATSRLFRSFICLPIKRSGDIYAMLNLFSKKADLFDSKEILLLEEVANDISFALDVFEKKSKGEQTEKNLQHSELRLRQAQSIAHVGSWELDFSDGLAVWSDEHCRIYGLDTSHNRHSFESWLSFIHPQDVDFVKGAIQGDGQSFNNASLQHRIVRKDGTVRHLNMHSQYELGEDGRPIGLYGVSHDVTQNREAEILLVQSEANLRMIMDLLPQRIFVKDESGKYLFVNNSFAELYGMEPKELITASRKGQLFISKESDTFTTDDRQVISKGKKKIIPEQRFVGPTGELKIFHVTKLPYFWGRAHQQSVLGILNEITEQKRAETERNALLADIVRRNESLEQFAYIISHNLRAPVANILALSGLLKMVEKDQVETAALLENLSASTKKLDEVIKDLNKILGSTHHTSEKKEKVSFSELCADVRLSMADQPMGEGAEIVTDFSAAQEMYVTKSYLYSIFYNLISNSIKYRRQQVPLLIKISSRCENGKIELSFQDNGMGMDLEQMGDQLFGLYKRFHDHVEGKGMGLYMVKRHVQILGGEISITSKVNKGTTFKIIFNI
jgi:PAS domain S-box-containing protein